MAEVISWDDLDKRKLYLNATTGLMTTRLLVYPPMLIKTRLQTQATQVYSGTLDAFRKIWRAEGVRGLYRGVIPLSVGVIPTQSTYITAYELVKLNLTKYVKSTDEGGENALTRTLGSWAPVFERIGIGGSASTCSSMFGVPIDVVTQRIQLHGSQDKTGNALQVIRRVWKNEGLRGFYRGYMASVMVFAPTSGCWWGTYGNMRHLLSIYAPSFAEWSPMGRDAISGAVAGSTAAMFTNPFDVVKTRIQTLGENGVAGQTPKWLDIASGLWKTEGLKGFYRGVTARMMTMAPTSTIMITCYEIVKRLSRKKD